ncbi:O-antigen ligase family protein [Noviherbaspirillum malthae]|uniref:O-antigen ligase family protein n=1 Tax=Noviherbaspirillum malthae TaxID=1260987 RepID=UPI00188FE971|nr:hypothetical protein [Noviherbaspirillum malthae]
MAKSINANIGTIAIPPGTNRLVKKGSKARFVVPAACAIMLTFGRTGFLPFEGIYSSLDQLINIFVVVVAPILIFKNICQQSINRNLGILLPLLALMFWVGSVLVIQTNSQNWPSQTALIDIFLAILFASQLKKIELRRLRHSILVLSATFSILTLLFARQSLNMILSGSLEARMGSDISNANLIIFPRVMYVLCITSVISIFLERQLWVKIGATVLMILPILIALATGGRGPLVAFFLTIVLLVILIPGKKKKALSLLVFGALAVIVYNLVISIFPVMQYRIAEEKDTGRMDVWSGLLGNDAITLFGRGVQSTYAHNIFIEFLTDYGIGGLFLFLVVLSLSFQKLVNYYKKSSDKESFFIISIFSMHFISQQFSLNIFYGGIWAAIILPLGFAWRYRNAKP